MHVAFIVATTYGRSAKFQWWARRDSNSHPVKDWNLNPARLPISPLARGGKEYRSPRNVTRPLLRAATATSVRWRCCWSCRLRQRRLEHLHVNGGSDVRTWNDRSD